MAVPFRAGAAAAALAFALVSFLSPAGHAQQTPQAPIDSTGGGPSTVSFDVKDRELSAVVDFIRARADVNIVVAPEITDKVTLSLKEVGWRQALDLVAERAGCVVVQSGPNLLRVEKPPRVHFAFQNVDITVVIDAIAKLANANIVIAPEVKGTITIRLKDVPWKDALTTAVKTLGYTVVEEERGILRVVPPESLVEQLEPRAFQL